jgi:DNA polymerase/3'-5' exonuclease PolX
MMAPFCERIEIAGSIRRGKPEVKDLEIVAIPKWVENVEKVGLFDEEKITRVNTLQAWGNSTHVGLQWIKPGTDEIIPWPLKIDGKYWRGYLKEEEIKLDLFLCTPKNWGMIMLIRTGSADFSREVVTHAKKIGRNVSEGHLTISGVPVDTPEESDVFRLLELEYVEPENRVDWQDLKRVKGVK